MSKNILTLSTDGKTLHGVEQRRWIKDVVIPEGVTVIGRGVLGLGVFHDCISLESIHLPNSLLEIQYDAFCNCSSLRSISIPPNVKTISPCSFNGCLSLNAINVDRKNPYYLSEDGILFDKEKSILLRFPPCTINETYTIPSNIIKLGAAFCDCRNLHSININNGLKSIGCYAFAGCSSLQSISIPNSVTHIEDHAFENCSSLQSISIPNSVIHIGNHAFAGCSSLQSISIPNSITSIGKGTFAGCSSLCNIQIPDSIVEIGEYAFSKCKSLKSIFIPNSIKELKNRTFSGCSSLQTVTISEGITKIWGTFSECVSLQNITIPESTIQLGGYAFGECLSLKEITIPKHTTSISRAAFIKCDSLQSFIVNVDNPEFSSDDGILFSKSRKTIVRYPPNKMSLTYAVPNETEHISDCSFQGCKYLHTVILNPNIISIGNSSFSSCNLLSSFSIPKDVKTIGGYIFKGCHSLKTIRCKIEDLNETTINPDAFKEIDCDSIKLIIPEKTSEAYCSHPIFSIFKNIVESLNSAPNDKIRVSQLLNQINASLSTLNSELQFLNLPIVSLNSKLDKRDADFLIKYFLSDEMHEIERCKREIFEMKKMLKVLFLRVHNNPEEMGELGKRQLFNLIIQKEKNTKNRPQINEFTEENFWRLYFWYEKWRNLRDYERYELEEKLNDKREDD